MGFNINFHIFPLFFSSTFQLAFDNKKRQNIVWLQFSINYWRLFSSHRTVIKPELFSLIFTEWHFDNYVLMQITNSTWVIRDIVAELHIKWETNIHDASKFSCSLCHSTVQNCCQMLSSHLIQLKMSGQLPLFLCSKFRSITENKAQMSENSPPHPKFIFRLWRSRINNSIWNARLLPKFCPIFCT